MVTSRLVSRAAQPCSFWFSWGIVKLWKGGFSSAGGGGDGRGRCVGGEGEMVTVG